MDSAIESDTVSSVSATDGDTAGLGMTTDVETETRAGTETGESHVSFYGGGE